MATTTTTTTTRDPEKTHRELIDRCLPVIQAFERDLLVHDRAFLHRASGPFLHFSGRDVTHIVHSGSRGASCREMVKTILECFEVMVIHFVFADGTIIEVTEYEAHEAARALDYGEVEEI